MVMGRTHALHGAAYGLAVSQISGAGIGLSLVVTGIGAGAAIAPDLDHGSATATRSLGLITEAASSGVRAISAAVYAATAKPLDRENRDGHRGITHTGPGALALGVIFGGSTALAGAFGRAAGIVATLGVIWLFLVWALRALPPVESKAVDYATATVLTGGAWWVLAHEYTGSVPLLLGATIASGAYVHSLGDGLTDYGSPLAWPLVIRGQRWYPCGMPEPLRFKAGKRVENLAVFPASIALVGLLAIGLIPGAYPAIWHAIVALAS
jgi:hypothetical protein